MFFLGRTLLRPLFLVALIGIPIAIWAEGGNINPGSWFKSIRKADFWNAENFGIVENESVVDPFADPKTADSYLNPIGTGNELLITPVNSPAEIFRFDVYPDWVRAQWPRVSTAAALPGLSGMRVAAVTGTNPWDLHGSLTYYFDDKQRVQKISFVGNTAEPSHLISSLSQVYGFKPHKSNSPGYYVAQKRGKPFGIIEVQYANVLSANDTGNQVLVSVEIIQPGSAYPLRNRFAQGDVVNQ